MYPGLDRLENRAAAIAVIEVIPPPPPDPRAPYDPTNGTVSGAHELYDVRINSVLKGPLEKGTTITMALRFLPAFTGDVNDLPTSAFEFDRPRPSSGRFIVFLEYQPDRKPARWASLNCIGAILALPSDARIESQPDTSASVTIRRIFERR